MSAFDSCSDTIRIKSRLVKVVLSLAGFRNRGFHTTISLFSVFEMALFRDTHAHGVTLISDLWP